MVQVETVMLEEVWSVKKGGEVICIGDASAIAVTFKPHMKLPESAKLHVAKRGRGEGPGDDALLI